MDLKADFKTRAFTSLKMLAAGTVVVGVVVFFVYHDENILSRILMGLGIGLSAGWMIGGFIWGWSITKKWFPPKPPRSKDHSSLDAEDFMRTMSETIRILLAVTIGLFAMFVGLIQGLILLIMFIVKRVKAKKARDAANASVAKSE